MAEPIVGMKYGTYDTLSAQNEKYYRKQFFSHDKYSSPDFYLYLLILPYFYDIIKYK